MFSGPEALRQVRLLDGTPGAARLPPPHVGADLVQVGIDLFSGEGLRRVVGVEQTTLVIPLGESVTAAHLSTSASECLGQRVVSERTLHRDVVDIANRQTYRHVCHDRVVLEGDVENGSGAEQDLRYRI